MNKFATSMKQIWRILYIFLTISLLNNSYAAKLPDLGNEFRSVLPIEKERLMGEMMMCEIRASGMFHTDPLVHEYVKYVGNRLTPYMSMPYDGMQIKFFAVNNDTINAFAFFDGHIAIHSGLIKTTETESELAGVMAHELAHISQQHSIRMMADNKRLMPITIAETIAAIAIGVPELILPAWAGHAQKMLNYSRQFEQEADRIGLQILSQAKFDAQGLPNILERMNIDLRLHNLPPEYLLTHPLFETRLSDIRSRANNFAFTQKPSPNMYHLVKARIKVQSATNLAHFIEEHEQVLQTHRYKNKLAADYTYGYALLLNGDLTRAWIELAPLAGAYPDDLIIQMTTAQCEMQMHQTNKALARMQHLKDVFPESSAVILQYATMLNDIKQPRRAQKLLAQYTSMQKPEAAYYECVRQTEGMLGNYIPVFEANSQWYLLHGDFNSAITQLDLALDHKQADLKSKKRLTKRKEELLSLVSQVKEI